VSFDGDPTLEQVAAEIARESARYPHLKPLRLHNAGGVTLYAIERTGERGSVFHSSDGSTPGEAWLIGDINYSDPGNRKEAIANVPSKDGATLGRSTWIQVTREPGKLRLRTDPLGIHWLYLAELPRGFAFSSDFAALARCLPTSASVDYDSVLLELALTYIPDDRTVLREIRLAPPGALLELSSKGIVVRERRETTYGDAFADASETRKFEILDDIFDSIVGTYIRPFDDQLVLSISAGYDSRYALAFLHKHRIAPSLCTFGDAESHEVQSAQRVCARVGWETQIYRPIDRRWDAWVRSTSLLGTTGLIQWNGWAEDWLQFERGFGTASTIGYLGDALTGKHLGIARDRKDWLRYWIDWSTKGGWAESPVLRADARKRFDPLVKGRLEESMRQASFHFPYQRALHLDVYGRQRRRVASQTNLISRFLTPVLFFYDERLIEFWSNLTLDDLLGQNLYLRYATSRFPHLFPQRERTPPGRVTRLARRLARAVTDRAPKSSRPLAVDHANMLWPNRDQILDLSKRVAPMLDHLIDMKAYRTTIESQASDSVLSTHDIIRGVNLFQLLDECLRPTP
jgi:hypothetical protein